MLIIDSGHGGRDHGGGSDNGIIEKDMNLKISKYQYKRFKELGIQVQMTRNVDIYISPNDRANRVKESGAEYCISNHINAGGGKGAEVIHSIFDKNSKLPELIKGEFKRIGHDFRRVFDKKGSNGYDYYFMHRETGSVKTYIVEYGFADNKEDAAFIKNHWKELAECVVKAYCLFLGNDYKKPKDEEKGKDGWWIVQSGAYREKKQADWQVKSLRNNGFKAYTWFMEE